MLEDEQQKIIIPSTLLERKPWEVAVYNDPKFDHLCIHFYFKKTTYKFNT